MVVEYSGDIAAALPPARRLYVYDYWNTALSMHCCGYYVYCLSWIVYNRFRHLDHRSNRVEMIRIFTVLATDERGFYVIDTKKHP